MTFKHFGAFRLGLAFLVVVQHFVGNLAPDGMLRNALLPEEVGSLAVLVFFCLSGFVITEAAISVYPGKPIAYFGNRLLRIVPHYLLALGVSIVIHFAFVWHGTLRTADRTAPSPDALIGAFGFRNILANLFGFLPGANLLETFDFVDIVWAVRVEMVFYVLVFFCLAAFTVARLRRIGLGPVAYGFAILLVPAVALAAAGKLPEKVGLVSYFAFGATLFLASTGRRVWPLVWLSLAGIVLHFATLPAINPQSNEPRDVLLQAVLLATMLAMMTFLALNRFSRFRAADRFLGDLSYPVYMHHQNVEIVLFSLVGTVNYPSVFIGIPLSLLVSYAMMRLIDPTVNRLRDRVRGRKTGIARDERSPSTILAPQNVEPR